MEFWDRVPQPWRYAAVITLSFAISIAGVLWAAHRHTWQEGGRGGALATLVSLAALFLRPDYGLRIYEARKARIKPNLSKLDELAEELKALVAGWRINSRGQAHQNRALVIASFIGTFFWGFGDQIAKRLM
jgi:hypothetical protein